MPRESSILSRPLADDYAINPYVDGTIVCRTPSAGEEGPLFSVLCRCGSRSGPYVTTEMANLMRDHHESRCLWPRT